MGALAAVFGTTFVVSLSGALAPGPLTLLTARLALRRGFWTGPAIAAGHGLLELGVVVALAAGVRHVADNDAFVVPIALFGGVILLWMGEELLRSAPNARLDLAPDIAIDANPRPRAGLLAAVTGGDETLALMGSRAALLVAVAAGVVVSVSNPYWSLWWASIGADYLRRAIDAGAAGVPVFYVSHVLSDVLWLSFIAGLLASGRRVVTTGLYRGLLVVFGVTLLGLGVMCIVTGVMEMG